jgi:hypothetical protein
VSGPECDRSHTHHGDNLLAAALSRARDQAESANARYYETLAEVRAVREGNGAMSAAGMRDDSRMKPTGDGKLCFCMTYSSCVCCPEMEEMCRQQAEEVGTVQRVGISSHVSERGIFFCTARENAFQLFYVVRCGYLLQKSARWVQK